MNIFWLHSNNRECVKFYTDAHVRKMILEYAQMLSTAQNECEGYFAGKVYKTTHANHPCTRWVMESKANYEALYSLWLELCYEYEHRFGKVHETYTKLEAMLAMTPNLPDLPFTKPPLCMPDEYKISDSVVECYRDYYAKAKRTDKNGKDLFKWTRRTMPYWLTTSA